MDAPKVERWPAWCLGDERGPHRYVQGQVVIGWSPCMCRTTRQPAGHRTYWCQLCGTVVLVPSCCRAGNTTDQMGLTPPDRTGPPRPGAHFPAAVAGSTLQSRSGFRFANVQRQACATTAEPARRARPSAPSIRSMQHSAFTSAPIDAQDVAERPLVLAVRSANQAVGSHPGPFGCSNLGVTEVLPPPIRAPAELKIVTSTVTGSGPLSFGTVITAGVKTSTCGSV